ncbi:MAG: glutamate--cysteine ligase [Alphaproteobacteria bacterium]
MDKIVDLVAEKINKNYNQITDFLNKKSTNLETIFYNSLDIRHSGFKIAVVDTNCFPAGFNNLVNKDYSIVQQEIINFFKSKFLGNFHREIPNKIILIPENHTRNLKYLENILILKNLLQSFAEVRIGSINPELKEITSLKINENQTLELLPIQLVDNKITTIDNFQAQVVILNNDLSDNIPDILKNTTTPIFPNPKLGWYQRRKSDHFTIYNQIVEELANLIDLDPWLISTYFSKCTNLDFKKQQNIELLAEEVEKIINKTQKKYQQYGIDEQPYVFIKADSGTYGMAVWSVKSATDVLSINKRERNKMNTTKGANLNCQVIIQEGLKTIDRIFNKSCEPLIYMVNSKVVANILRANGNRDNSENLNSLGAEFFNLNNSQNFENFIKSNSINNSKNLLLTYDLLARIGSIASAYENFNNNNN